MTEITPERFDATVATRDASRPAHVIWTASAIGRRIGTSADFVRDKLAKEPGSPVKLVGGRYCALEDELLNFFRPAA